MHIQIVCPVFPPEAVASAVMAQHIAEGLRERKHTVDVITSFPSKPTGRVFDGYERRLFWNDPAFSDYAVFRCQSFISSSSELGSRFLENLTFGISSNLTALRLRRPDVVYVNTWPIVSSGLTRLLCWLRRVPMVLNVQDVYPESAVGLSHFRADSLWVRLMRLLDTAVSRTAAHVVVISENFRDIYRQTRGVPDDRISVVYNWYDDQVVPAPPDGALRRSFTGGGAGFVAMYAGNVGAVAGLEMLLRVATLLHVDDQPIQIVIAGDGTSRPALEEEVERRGLSNVRFHYPLLRHELAHVHSAADVLLITTRSSLSLSEVPSKIIAYMLSGRPVIAAVDPRSDTAAVVRSADCGIVVRPEDETALAAVLRSIAAQPAQLASWGRNARQFAERHFMREANVARIAEVIEEAGIQS